MDYYGPYIIVGTENCPRWYPEDIEVNSNVTVVEPVTAHLWKGARMYVPEHAFEDEDRVRAALEKLREDQLL